MSTISSYVLEILTDSFVGTYFGQAGTNPKRMKGIRNYMENIMKAISDKRETIIFICRFFIVIVLKGDVSIP